MLGELLVCKSVCIYVHCIYLEKLGKFDFLNLAIIQNCFRIISSFKNNLVILGKYKCSWKTFGFLHACSFKTNAM
jgi:hypothetical protein